MFILANSLGRFIMLRCCECGENLFVEPDKFKNITEDYVILKDNIKIGCKCGATQSKDDRYIPLEPQIIRNSPQAPDISPNDIDIQMLMQLNSCIVDGGCDCGCDGD